MDRRRFVWLAAAVAGTTHTGLAQTPAVRIVLPQGRGRVMPVDFTGLSYEAGQLYNAEYFSPRNTALIAAFRGLSGHGVLRLGGHLSNITPWEGVGQDEAKQVRGVRHGIEDYWEWPLVDPSIQRNKKGMITRKAIENLRGFLDAVDWRLMYGLNFASGSATRAADEASFVAKTMGDRLVAFVIGNEVDGFAEDQFFRAKGYGIADYLTEYEAWMKTIRAKVPGAKFTGPDTEGQVGTWVKEFAKQGFAQRAKGEVVLLTSHFYGMGPASDPKMTAERLLRKVNPELEEQIVQVDVARALAGGTPYRMDEGNSCFGGGRPGVSDAYASALWAADYMLRIACAGFVGVNLHGGGTGFYTPIETSDKFQAKPRPVYYGMQLAQRFAGFAVAPCVLKTGANVTAYVGTKSQERLLAMVNKGAEAIRFELPETMRVRERWVLQGPSLDAKEGVRFAKEGLPGKGAVEVAGYSAVLFVV